jgi:nickel transport protein
MSFIFELFRIHWKMKSWLWIIIIIIMMLILNSPMIAYAHGVVAGYSKQTGIVISANYDTGHPMSEAQVSVFAPDNPAKPWLTSTLDKNGRFSFVPDASLPGTWSVQVRQLGHGAMIHIPMSENGIQESASGPANLSLLQRLVMAVCVVWGSVGTALYFSRKRKKEK